MTDHQIETVSEDALAKAVASYRRAVHALTPDYVEFPVEVWKAIAAHDPVTIRVQLGTVNNEVVGFATPIDADGIACGPIYNTGEPCPPFCPDGA